MAKNNSKVGSLLKTSTNTKENLVSYDKHNFADHVQPKFCRTSQLFQNDIGLRLPQYNLNFAYITAEIKICTTYANTSSKPLIN